MGNKKYKKWTAEEDLVISSMREKGATTKEIAKFLNRTPYSVSSRIKIMINCCTLKKKNNINIKTTKHLRLEKPKVNKPVNSLKTNTNKKRESKIDYDEVARRIENGGLRNIQKTLREYSKEVGVSIRTLHYAYYSESQSKTRIKDRVRAYTIVTPKGLIQGANKNTDKPIININVWQKLKMWISSFLVS